jgi:hypothetical protein
MGYKVIRVWAILSKLLGQVRGAGVGRGGDERPRPAPAIIIALDDLCLIDAKGDDAGIGTILVCPLAFIGIDRAPFIDWRRTMGWAIFGHVMGVGLANVAIKGGLKRVT